MTHTPNIQSTVSLQGIHALIHLVDLIARPVSFVTTNNQQATSLLSVDKSWILSQFVIFDIDLATSAFEWLIKHDRLVPHLNQLVLVDFNSELNL
jgi:hypothetical protein